MEIASFYSHRFAKEILDSVQPLNQLWLEIEDAILSISDDEIIAMHNEIQSKENTKSLSKAINRLIDRNLKNRKWKNQSGIFGSAEYQEGKESTWTLDFSKSCNISHGRKSGIAVEVAFNHAEAAAWNLMKPVLAAEINDVRVQTNIGEGIGIVIVASPQLKKNGAFDGAIGDYQRYLKTIKAMRSQLTAPILLIGLEAPRTFKVQTRDQKNNPYKSGEIIPLTV